MPDPTSPNTDDELNTAKQVLPENVGALNRDQLTPEAAAAPQGHDVPGHDHPPALPLVKPKASRPATDSCCSVEPPPRASQSESDEDEDDHGHGHGPAAANPYIWPGVSLALLLGGIALNYYDVAFFTSYVRLGWYGIAFLLVGWKVMKAAVLSIPSGNVFNEFLLMSIPRAWP
jgi:Cd2+/Zn2+-exporting ATPase